MLNGILYFKICISHNFQDKIRNPQSGNMLCIWQASSTSTDIHLCSTHLPNVPGTSNYR